MTALPRRKRTTVMTQRPRTIPIALTAAALLAFAAASDAAPDGEAPGESARPAAPVLHATLDAARQAAAEAGATVMAVLTAPNCPDCRWFCEQALPTAAFSDGAERLHVVVVDIAADREIAEALSVREVPDLLLMTPDGVILARNQGAKASEELTGWLDAALKVRDSGSWLGADAGLAGLPSGRLSEEQLAAVVAMFASSEPEQRNKAIMRLTAEGDNALPALIATLEDPYLGMRIGAHEVLRRLLPEAPPFDPWAESPERQQQAEALRQWWIETGEPAVDLPSSAGDPDLARALEEALVEVTSEEPAERTRGMSSLRFTGRAALPKIREAMTAAVRAGDASTARVLDDVRWAILVPDSVESKLHVRHALARGTSQRRQWAASRLAGGGNETLAALAELAGDDDPLVQEVTLGSLKTVGGREAVGVMARLLDSGDSNLRMVAAQQLGESGDATAAPRLAARVMDRDEVVACAAIAALAELEAKSQTDTLITCLADPRWRVRSAAAKALGELDESRAAPALMKLIDDEDPFVVRTALDAMKRLGARPDSRRLHEAAKRMPALSGQAALALARSGTPDDLKRVLELYTRSDAGEREGIVGSLTGLRHEGNSDPAWRPLLEAIAGSDHPGVRRRLVDLLSVRPRDTAAELLGPLLEDADPDVRSAAAGLLLRVAAYHYGIKEQGHDSGAGYGILSGPGDADLRAKVDALHKQWHASLKKALDGDPAPLVFIAFYITGAAGDHLPELAEVFSVPETTKALSEIYGATELLLSRLHWPAGRPVLEAACRHPAGYGKLLEAVAGNAPAEVRNWLLEPDRLLGAIEAADADTFSEIAETLLQDFTSTTYGSNGTHSRTTTVPRRVIARMADSKVDSARALGIFMAGTLMGDAKEAVGSDRIKAALGDDSPWVRVAAVQALSSQIESQETLEEVLGPLLADRHARVVEKAAAALLALPLRSATNQSYYFWRFSFAGGDVYTYIPYYDSDSLPQVFDRKPAFLATLPTDIDKLDGEPLADLLTVLALLRAQYGDTSGLDRLLQQWRSAAGEATQYDPMTRTLLAALAMTGEARFLPVLKAMIEQADDASDLRRLLTYLRGRTDSESRSLRREINRRMRRLRY